MGNVTSKFKDLEKDPKVKAAAKEAYEKQRTIVARTTKKPTKWNHDSSQPPQSEVQHAVYEAEGWLEWQGFRIALKKWGTWEKLVLLEWYLENYSNKKLAKIRVDNYIYALKRGGQLNAELEIAR